MTDRKNGLRHRLLIRSVAIGLAASTSMLAMSPALAQQPVAINIPEQRASDAITRLARQTGTQILFDHAQLRRIRSRAVNAVVSPREALRIMLEGSSFEVAATASGALVIRPRAATGTTPVSGEAQAGGAAAGSESVDGGATPEILVIGSRSQNADIPRGESGSQPYVVFGSADIEDSGALTIDEFLRNRLPMNSQVATIDQQSFGMFTEGQINLRGLGTEQTLILVDGRRIPGSGVPLARGLGQPTINGIPPSAIERIEVLPATASGIYGGGATGGVINIILKRDYRGVDLQASFGDNFGTNVHQIDLSGSAGVTLGSGTRILVNGRYGERGRLLPSERDFARRGRSLTFANDLGQLVGTAPIQGATPNICSARDRFPPFRVFACGGPVLVTDSGQPVGSNFTFVPDGYPGPSSDSGTALAANGGNLSLNAPENAGQLLSSSTLAALSLDIRQAVGAHVEIFASAEGDRTIQRGRGVSNLIVDLPSSHPNNPFQQDIRVALNIPGLNPPSRREIENIRLRGGAIVRLGDGWSASMEHSWGASRIRSLNSTGANSPTPATQEYLRSIALQDLRSSPPGAADQLTFNRIEDGPWRSYLEDTSLRVSGPLIRLPAGPLVWSGLIERRTEGLRNAFSQSFAPTPGPVTFYPSRSQKIWSFYGEVRAPLLTRGAGGSLLDITVALRHDRYSSEAPVGESVFTITDRDALLPPVEYGERSFSSTDFTLAAQFSPLPDVSLRASFGTGFLPPNLGQITTSEFIIGGFFGYVDPRRGNTTTLDTGDVIQTEGGGPELRPEQSQSLSVGIILTPSFLPGLRLSIDYIRTRKTDEISSLSGDYWITNESTSPGRVTRGPRLPGDPADWAGPIIAIDNTLINIASAEVQAFDFQVDYRLPSRFGEFHPFVVATLQTRLRRQVTPDEPSYDTVGFVDGPLRWRANMGLDWRLNRMAAGLNLQYFDSYSLNAGNPLLAPGRATQITNQGYTRIRSQTYVDGFLRYRFGMARPGNSSFSGPEVTLSVQNIFGSRPPIIAETFNFVGGYSQYGDPRGRRFLISLRNSF